jgi:aminomethyltransferase
MALKHTPLYPLHQTLGARIVDFAGFEMPVQYSSIKLEHAAVRDRAGIFDVSHMGQIHFHGPAAIETVERLVTCPVASLKAGGVRYGMLCNERGGVVDDVTVYRVSEDALFLCVNAANIEKDLSWIQQHAPPEAGVSDRSAETALIALQGPLSCEVFDQLGSTQPSQLGRFSFAPMLLSGVETLVSRTGYTGSDGFEIYLGAGDAQRIFQGLLTAGEQLADGGAVPCGLGARDTLRLEAALPLYGHELDDDTSPLEAGLERFVKTEAGGFIGAEAIKTRALRGHLHQLVGFELTDRGVARDGYAIHKGGEVIGRVTSGSPSPTLGKSIGLGYVDPAHAAVGTPISVEIRGRATAAVITKTPFVSARKR